MQTRTMLACAAGALALAAAVSAGTYAATTRAHTSYADDRAAIENLMFRYVYAMDFRDPQRYAGTFAPDGVLNYAGGTLTGRTAIANMIQGLKDGDDRRGAGGTPFPTPQPRTHHYVTNVALDIEGDHATGRAYWVSIGDDGPVQQVPPRAANAPPRPAGYPAPRPSNPTARITGFGHYEDEEVKINGKWLFKSRHIFNELVNGREAVYPLVQPGGP